MEFAQSWQSEECEGVAILLKPTKHFYCAKFEKEKTDWSIARTVLKNVKDITKSVTSFWKIYTVSDFLQMNNELPFRTCLLIGDYRVLPLKKSNF